MTTYIIDHERYGSTTATFPSLDRAEREFRALGEGFADTRFTVCGDRIVDERGDTVGHVERVYGICYGTTDDTTIIECASLEAARTLAHETLSAAIPSVDIVELEGAGPYYDSDGQPIADTHTPARTLATVTRETPAQALGRKGGSVASEAQKAAARLNGRKGGRPRKSQP